MSNVFEHLSPQHYEEICVSSAVNDDVAEERGYRTLKRSEKNIELLESYGFGRPVWGPPEAWPVLLIPMTSVHGTETAQIKRKNPREFVRSGKQVKLKYETPKGSTSVIDVPAFTRARLKDTDTPLWITEGVKKTDSLVSQGVAALGITGVYNWRNSQGTLGDWEDIPLKGRTVTICFDADASTNRHVLQAMRRLGGFLTSKGASKVKYLVVPAEVNDTPVKGVDDFFCAGGTLDQLEDAASATVPGGEPDDGAFTEALLSERLFEEALEGKFLWVPGLNWMRWDGCVWKDVADAHVQGLVRQWAVKGFQNALTDQKKNPSKDLSNQIAGWRAAQSRSRIDNITTLARGQGEEIYADQLDSDPDILGVKNGAVHLPTGELRPADPELYLTKSCSVDYVPGATHPLWTKALKAVPAEALEWFQERVGQAATGYMTPDDTMLVLHGGGENGKSAIADAIRNTLGTYSVLVSDRLLMGSGDNHSTEMMDLRGARYAVLEETPEERRLDVQSLKKTVGTESITARRMRQDPVTFSCSHSLFINTNYRPEVVATDDGTWRRLLLMPFPYRFVKPGTPLRTEWELPGDPEIKAIATERSERGDRFREAVLAWIVEGAQRYLNNPAAKRLPPQLMENAKMEWRRESDSVLDFASDHLEYRDGVMLTCKELLETFNEWLEGSGRHKWTDRTFSTRFGGHELARTNQVVKTTKKVNGKASKVWYGVTWKSDDEPQDGPGNPGGGHGPQPAPQSPSEPPAGMPEAPADQFPAAASLAVQHGPVAPAAVDERRCSEAEGQVVTFDLETCDADQLFTGEHEGPFVRLAGYAIGKDGEVRTTTDIDELIAVLNSAKLITGHNITLFDLIALAHHHGADFKSLAAKAFDTLTGMRLVDPIWPGIKSDMQTFHAACKRAGIDPKSVTHQSHTLNAACERYSVPAKTDDIKTLAKQHGGFDRIPVDDEAYLAYLIGDVTASRGLFIKIWGDIKRRGLMDAMDRETRLDVIKGRMVLAGMPVDREILQEAYEAEQTRLADAWERVYELGIPRIRPEGFQYVPKIKGGEQVAPEVPADTVPEDASLYNKRKIKEIKDPLAGSEGQEILHQAFLTAGVAEEDIPRTEKGALSFNKHTLGREEYAKGKERLKPLPLLYPGNERVADLCARVIDVVVRDRKMSELLDNLTEDGRVHSKIGAQQASGRWAHTSPSTTNLGKHGEKVRERSPFVAGPGKVMLSVDLDQIDARIVAALSQDPRMLSECEPGVDMHEVMGRVLFGDATYDSDPKKYRKLAKAPRHGRNYGQGAAKMAAGSGIPVEEMQAMYKAMDKGYPDWVKWQNNVRDEAVENRYHVHNGYRPMRVVPGGEYTNAPAQAGQGGTREVIVDGLLRMDDELVDRLRLVIHDEVLLEVEEDRAEEFAKRVVQCFSTHFHGVPVTAGASVGKSWMDACDEGSELNQHLGKVIEEAYATGEIKSLGEFHCLADTLK